MHLPSFTATSSPGTTAGDPAPALPQHPEPAYQYWRDRHPARSNPPCGRLARGPAEGFDPCRASCHKDLQKPPVSGRQTSG